MPIRPFVGFTRYLTSVSSSLRFKRRFFRYTTSRQGKRLPFAIDHLLGDLIGVLRIPLSGGFKDVIQGPIFLPINVRRRKAKPRR